MTKKITFVLTYAAFVLLIGIFVTSCETGVDSSSEPGIIRVLLQADPSDTTLIVINDTLSLHDTVTTVVFIDSVTTDTVNVPRPVSFPQIVFQGRAYQDSLFTILLNDLNSYRQSDDTAMVFMRNGKSFQPQKIYESFAPPGNYTKLEFGLKSNFLYVYPYFVPVSLPENAESQISLERNFKVEENTVTEIIVQIKPLSSVERYRDKYIYNRKVEIIDVRYY